jgi:hypothetical protein
MLECEVILASSGNSMVRALVSRKLGPLTELSGTRRRRAKSLLAGITIIAHAVCWACVTGYEALRRVPGKETVDFQHDSR